jgi:hypothetical protein
VQRYLIASLSDEHEKAAKSGEDALIDAGALDELKASWLIGLKTKFSETQLLAHVQLARVLYAWSAWGDHNETRAWCEAATTSDDGLLTFLTKFCSHTRSQTMGDWAVRLHPRLNPTSLERYVDTTSCARRLIDLRQAGVVPETAREAVDQFLKEFEMLKAIKNPDGHGVFDD